jgi:hypothetical protein
MFRSQSDHHAQLNKQWTSEVKWSEVHLRAYGAPDDGHFVTETYVGQL